MFDIPKIPKQIKKKISRYHRWNLKWFGILIGTGIISLILAIGITYLAIYFETVTIEIIYVIFGLMYLFTFSSAPSAFLIMKYFTDTGVTSEIFRNKIRLLRLIEELESNQDEKISEFQKICKSYTRTFYNLYWDYFKQYSKREKTSYLTLQNYFIEFDKIITLVSVNAEVHSNKTKELLSDFSDFLNVIENKILIPILERKIQRNDVKNFCQRWTKYFNNNYKTKYRETSKTLDEHIMIQREKHWVKSQRVSKIIEGIVATIVGGLILLLIQLITESFPL